MSAKYWQRGETIDYTPTDDLANGDVVDLATRIGVAGRHSGPAKPARSMSWACSRSPRPPAPSRWARPFTGTRRRRTSPQRRAAAPRTPRPGWAVAAAGSSDATVLVKLLG